MNLIVSIVHNIGFVNHFYGFFMLNNEKIEFGKRLREVRISYNLSVSDMADKLEVGRSSFHYYEKGHRLPDVRLLFKLNQIYGVDINWLVTGIKISEFDDLKANYTAEDLRLIDILARQKPETKQGLLRFLDGLVI